MKRSNRGIGISSSSDDQFLEDIWLNNLNKKINKVAVQPARVDQNLFHQINSIMHNKSKYPSVEAAVEDMKERSGLTSYLKNLNKLSQKENEERIVSALNKIKQASVEEDSFPQSIGLNSWNDIQNDVKKNLNDINVEDALGHGDYRWILSSQIMDSIHEKLNLSFEIYLSSEEHILDKAKNLVSKETVKFPKVKKISVISDKDDLKEAILDMTIGNIKSFVNTAMIAIVSKIKSFVDGEKFDGLNDPNDVTQEAINESENYYDDEYDKKYDIAKKLNQIKIKLQNISSEDFNIIKGCIVEILKIFSAIDEDIGIRFFYESFGIEDYENFIKILRQYGNACQIMDIEIEKIKSSEELIDNLKENDIEELELLESRIQTSINYMNETVVPKLTECYNKLPKMCKNGLPDNINNFLIDNNLIGKAKKIVRTKSIDFEFAQEIRFSPAGIKDQIDEKTARKIVSFFRKHILNLSSKTEIIDEYINLLKYVPGSESRDDFFKSLEITSDFNEFRNNLSNYLNLLVKAIRVDEPENYDWFNDLILTYRNLPKICKDGLPEHVKVKINNPTALKLFANKKLNLTKLANNFPKVLQKYPEIKNTISNYIRQTKGNLSLPAILEKIKNIHSSDVANPADWEDDNLIVYISQLNLKEKANNPTHFEHSNLGTYDNNDSDFDNSNTEAFPGLSPYKG